MSPQTAATRTEWSRRLARALIQGGYVQETAIAPILGEATQSDSPLGNVLIQRGVVPAGVVVNTLAQLARLPAIDLQAEPPAADVSTLIPPLLAQDHRALVVRVVGNQAVVAFAEPPEAADVKSIGNLINREMVPVLGDPVTIDRYLGITAQGAPQDRPPMVQGCRRPRF